MGFISNVHAALFLLVLLAGSYVTRGKHLIFPSKVQFPSLSILG
uniref:Uncharacterized protein n=1 Tax=Arundo donax TaxID=35708 RepID=A0A0A9HNX3_ARUDO